MTSTLQQLIFAGGMDQNNNTTVGPPGIQRLERARFVEPGQIVVSNGYKWDSTLAAAAGNTGMRQLFQVGNVTGVIHRYSNGNTYWLGAQLRDSESVITNRASIDMPPFEAPRRVDWSPRYGTYMPYAGTDLAVHCMAISGSIWAAFAIVEDSAGNRGCAVTVYDGFTQISRRPGTIAAKYLGVVTDSTVPVGGESYLWSCEGNNIVVRKIDPTTYAFVVVRTFTFGAPQTVIDAALTDSGLGYKTITFLNNTSVSIDTYRLDNGAVISSVIPTAIAGSPLAISAYADTLARLSTSGYVKHWTISTGAVTAADQQIPGLGGVTFTQKGSITHNTGTLNGLSGAARVRTAAICFTDAAGMAYTRAATYYNNAGTLVWLFNETLGQSTLCGRPAVVDNKFLVPITGSGLISRAVNIVDATSYLDATVISGLQGEMPVPTQTLQGGVVAATSVQFCPPASLVEIDPFTGLGAFRVIWPFPVVSSGQLNTTMCELAFAALAARWDPGDAYVPNYRGLQPIDLGEGVLLIPNGKPWLDGAHPSAAGIMLDAPTPTLTAGGGGAVFSAGAVYQYSIVGELRDSAGNLYLSAPSQPVPFTPGANLASISVSAFWRLQKPFCDGTIRVYRTVANGTVFYELPIKFNWGTATVYSDTTTDANLVAGRILYTQAENAFGGLKPRYGCPPCKFGARGKDRLIIGGVEHANRVRWSLTFYSGEGIVFPNPSEIGWYYDFPCDEITAVWALDDAWVVASRDKIWLVYGTGPDDNGRNGSFDPPRLVSATLGIISHKSLCEIPDGLLFQGSDAQLYLLRRGQYTVEWYSSQVKNELADGIAENTRVLRNPVCAIVYNEGTNTIHVFRVANNNQTNYPLVYNLRLRSWSIDGDLSDGLNGCLSAAKVRDPGPTGATTVATVTATHLTYELTNAGNTGGSPAGGVWDAQITTNDFAPFGFGGWGRVNRVEVIGRATEAASVPVSIWRNRSQGIPDETAFMALSDPSGFEDYPQLVYAVVRPKTSAIRFKLEWSTRSYKPTGMTFEVEQAARAERGYSARRK